MVKRHGKYYNEQFDGLNANNPKDSQLSMLNVVININTSIIIVCLYTYYPTVIVRASILVCFHAELYENKSAKHCLCNNRFNWPIFSVGNYIIILGLWLLFFKSFDTYFSTCYNPYL